MRAYASNSGSCSRPLILTPCSWFAIANHEQGVKMRGLLHDPELEAYARMRGQMAAEDETPNELLPSLWVDARGAFLWFSANELLTAEELNYCQVQFEEA